LKNENVLKEKLELIPKTYYSYLYTYNCLETINIRFCKLYPVATLNSSLFFNIPQSSIKKSLTAFVILVTNLLFKIPSALFINGIGEPALKIHILLEANNIKYISDSSPFPKRKEKKEIFTYSDGYSDGAGGRGSCFGIDFFFA
jgi:hypothetical protein